MPEVEAPFVGAEVDTSDPIGSFKEVLLAVGGIGLLVMLMTYGRQFGNWATSQTDDLLGLNAGGNNPLTRGDL